MSDRSKNSSPKSAATPSTPSPASEAGPTPFALPDGQTVFPFGRALVPASRLALRGFARVRTMRATCGPTGSVSSGSVALQSSLANRLQAQMRAYGSPLFTLTWKHWVIDSGLRICAQRALQPRTSGNGCFSWRTPMASDCKAGISRGPDRIRLIGQAQPFTVAGMGVPLNPAFVRWLMGLPEGWDDCLVTETQLTLNLPPSS